MNTYLIDCNHFSAALRKVSKVRERLLQAHRGGHALVSCHPILCELELAILQSDERNENRRRLKHLLRHIRLRPLDHETVRHYGEVYFECKSKGRVLSQIDMMQAALARQHTATILSTDRDFEALPDLTVEDWTV